MPHHRKSAKNIAQHEKLKTIVENLQITGRIVNMVALRRQLEFGNLKLKNVVRELLNYSESVDSDAVEKTSIPGLSDELAKLITVVKTNCDVKDEKLKTIVENLQITGRIVNMVALRRQLEFGNLKLKNVVRELLNYSESLDSDAVEKANIPGLSDELAKLITVVKTNCHVKERDCTDGMPLPADNSPLEAENHKRRALTIADIPLVLVKDIVKNLHPLEKFGCYEVCTGMRQIVERSLPEPTSLGIYICDTTCVVFSDGDFCKYNKEVGGCGYEYGTFEPRNGYGIYPDNAIRTGFLVNKSTGFLENVKYVNAGLNVFLSVLTKHGHHFKKLTIKVENGFNPNKMIRKIDKKLISLHKSLSVDWVDLVHLTPKQMMRIVRHLKPEILEAISLEKNAYGKDDDETMRMIARTVQWKKAQDIRVCFPTTIPIRKFLHLVYVRIERHQMTAREVANLRNSVLKHTHIVEIELVIHNPTFNLGILRRVLGPYIPNPMDADAQSYLGPNRLVDVYITTGRQINQEDISITFHSF